MATTAKYIRPINRYTLLRIDGDTLHALTTRRTPMLWRRMRRSIRRVWYCCQCQGRIDYGEIAWRPVRVKFDYRICEGCASQLPGYRETGETSSQRNRPAQEMRDRYPLIAHAYRELDIAGLFDDGVDIGACVLKMVEALARADIHQPATFDLALKTLWDLAHMRPLSKLTADPGEWKDISAQAGRPLWQSIRDHEAYSTNGGKTFYRVDNPAAVYKSRTYKEDRTNAE